MLITGSAAITLAFTVDRSTLQVIDNLHEEADSADVWLYGDPEVLEGAAGQTEVTSAGPLSVTLAGRLVHEGEAYDATIWGLERTPEVSPALLTSGRWPDAAATDEVAIDVGLSRQAGVDLGERLTLIAADSRAATYEVVGIVTPAVQVPYPQEITTIVFVSAEAVEGLAGGLPTDLTDGEQAALGLEFVLGVRLGEAVEADQFAAGLPELTATTWPEIRTTFVEESAGPPTMLRVFALFAVMASAFVVAATISNHALAQKREIGLLKAVGVTPGQTTSLLLMQMLAISLPSALIGIMLAVLATPLFQWSITDMLQASAARSVSIPVVLIVFVVVQLLVVACALLPAMKAGRTRIVDAVALAPRQVGTGASIVARVTERLGLPQVFVLGAKDTFTKPLRSWFIIAAIAVAAATLMMTFSFRFSLDRLISNPALVGSMPYELQVTPLGELTPVREDETGLPSTVLPHEEAETLIDAQPGVAAHVTDRSGEADVEGQRVLHRAIGGDIEAIGYQVVSGRLFAQAGEAVVGLGLALALDLGEGDQLELEILPGEPVTLEIVGVYLADENEGLTVMYDLDTVLGIDAMADPGAFNLRLRDGVDREAIITGLASASEGSLATTDLTRESGAIVEGGRQLIPPMTLLGAGLAVLAAANLLSSLVFSVRERTAEFGILKSIGLTPRQVVAVVMLGVAPLALIGTVIGAPLGYWLIDTLMRGLAEAHQPADIIQVPSAPWLVALVSISLLISFVGALVPAILASRLGVSEALRTE